MHKFLLILLLIPSFVLADPYGDIPTDLDLAASTGVRRNAGDTAFEAFTPAVDTSAATICGAGEYLEGDGTCDVLSGGGHTDGANCSAGSYPLGVDGDGVVQSCTDASTEVDSIVATHTAITDAHHTATIDTNTNASTICSGTTTYLDGEGNCDDISSVYEPAGITESDISDLSHTTDTTVWSLSGSNAYYTDGDVGIGDTSPATTIAVNGDATFGVSSSATNAGADVLISEFGANETLPASVFHVDSTSGIIALPADYNRNLSQITLSRLNNTAGINILSSNAHSGYLNFGDTDNSAYGVVRYNHVTDEMSLGARSNEIFKFDFASNFYLGRANNGSNVDLQFPTSGNTGALSWIQGSDRFEFYDDVVITDNEKFFLGTGVDASLVYDGTDLKINSQEVGSGDLIINSSGGNVGIGTTSPDYLLGVAGDVGADGTISLLEQADANADVAGYGQIWVNTATPNELYFTDDAGTDVQLGRSDPRAFGAVVGDGVSVITTGQKGYIEIPFDCTISKATVLLDQSGSIVIDVWKDTYANYPPVDADSITASAPPTVSSATKSQDSTLTGWTTSVTAGDIIGFNVDSITTATKATLSITCDR